MRLNPEFRQKPADPIKPEPQGGRISELQDLAHLFGQKGRDVTGIVREIEALRKPQKPLDPTDSPFGRKLR